MISKKDFIIKYGEHISSVEFYTINQKFKDFKDYGMVLFKLDNILEEEFPTITIKTIKKIYNNAVRIVDCFVSHRTKATTLPLLNNNKVYQIKKKKIVCDLNEVYDIVLKDISYEFY